ncbi:hypothetical protein [Streptomyces sp. NPDC088794]|uniref:zinc finger domain-containing protein n=1 Tax=Streptomyces sp. NPDC088794 TaxID=3365902 RepID=UPI003811E2B3
MTAREPVTPQMAWMTAMRDEALRMDRPEISKIVHVGQVIASYADSDGTNADPGTDVIAAIVGSSEETVSRAKKVLKALGVLVERRRPNTNSAYQLRLCDGPLDWDAHMTLYTDTPQARRKKRLKAKQLETATAPAVQNLPPDDDQESRASPTSTPSTVRAVPAVPTGPGTGPLALAPVLARGRGRRTAAPPAATQPPLLMAVNRLDTPIPEEILQTLAEQGVPAALRAYGRDPVMRLLSRDGPGGTRAPYLPPELTVPCGYCEVSVGSPCRNDRGLRALAHTERLDTWATVHTSCPNCAAPANGACTERDGTPYDGIHAQRVQLGAEFRAAADRPQHTSTGT